MGLPGAKASTAQLTFFPLISYNDEECYTGPKGVQSHTDGTCYLDCLSTQTKDHIMVGGAVIEIRTVRQDEQGCYHKYHKHLEVNEKMC